MAVSTGTVLFKDGKYLLDIGSKAVEVSEKRVSDPALLKSMVGKKVDVTLSSGRIAFPVAITLAQDPRVVVVKRLRLTCYVPLPDIIKNFGEIDHTNIAKTLLDKQVIDRPTYEMIV